MTLFLDTTALLARHVAGPDHGFARRVTAGDAEWCLSALALSEAIVVAGRAADPAQAALLERALRDDWDRCWVVPVDEACLDRAAQLGRAHPLRVADAIHLAAADRLPRPLSYITFDAHQIPVAMALGLDVVSPPTPPATQRAGRHPSGMVE